MALARFGRWWLACAAVAFVGYLALFSWDHGHDIFGRETSGPYSWWQVVLLLGALLLVTRSAVNARSSAAPVVAIPVVLSTCFGLDWTASDDSGLAELGVAMLAVGSFVGTVIVVWFLRIQRDERDYLGHLVIRESRERQTNSDS